MILRKPYALLIKYFRRINIVLLALVLFLFYKTMKFHQFAKNYLSTNIYNSKIDSITNYINIYIVLAFLFVFIICVILIYLLRKKDKPHISYMLIVIVNIFSLILLLYSGNFFTYKALEGFKIVNAKMINDLSLVANILYYPLIFILLIRSLGIDLKSFGFQEDKEFIEISEEDREEVEVEAKFDKEKWLRNTKYYFRNTKYFIVEHKIALLGALLVVFVIGLFQFYQYFYITNRVYGMNQVISSNNYKLKLKNTYLTDKDYSGNIITSDNTYFIVVDLEIKNTLNRDRDFDIEKVLLYVDDNYYVPTTRFNDYFKDMGNLYTGNLIKPKETVSYLLIYDVAKPKDNANFILKYQDVGSNKLVQVKIKVLDISTFKEKDDESYPNYFNIPINLDTNMKFKISNYSITSSVSYTYQQCNSNGSCPVYQDTYTIGNNKKILNIKFSLDGSERNDFLDFINNYAKIKYVVDGVEKEVSIKHAISKTYRGNHLYLVVDNDIEKASSIDLIFTIRAYKYTYHLKGE